MGVKIQEGFIRRIATYMQQPNDLYRGTTTNRQAALDIINTKLKESVDEDDEGSCIDDIFYIESQDLFVFKTVKKDKEGFLISFKRLEKWCEFRNEMFSACGHIIPRYDDCDEWRKIIAAMILVAKRI